MVDKLLRITGLGQASAAIARLSRLINRLIRRQIERTGQEMGRDVRRLVLGLLLVGFGFIFAFIMLILLHVGAGLLITSKLSAMAAVGILLAIDGIITTTLFIISIVLIRKPFLANTRKEVIELYQLIMEE